MTHEAPAAAGLDEYRHLGQEDIAYLDTLRWTDGTCGWHGRECSPRVTVMHIEQGTLPGGRVTICRHHAGLKLFLARQAAANRVELDYRPDINAA